MTSLLSLDRSPSVRISEKGGNMIKINMKKMNVFTILAFLLLIAGVLFYIYWGIRFGVWADIGIYSVTVFFVLAGILGILLTLYEKTEESI